MGPTGGRTWWAHFEFTRINIEPTIQKNEIEETLDILDVGHFLGVLDGMLPRRLAGPSPDVAEPLRKCQGVSDLVGAVVGASHHECPC